jgi:hypothetical protein
MFFSLALTLTLTAFQQTACRAGEVLGVEHGRDYMLNICGLGPLALRGVEPPLRTADVVRLGEGKAVGGEVLGGKNVGPDALAHLAKVVGQRVTLVYDGYRIGDREGRRYAYVFLADRTLLNAEMIQRGYGYADRQGSHPRRGEFIALEDTTRRSQLGVWSTLPTP